jgi:hypothetical protein
MDPWAGRVVAAVSPDNGHHLLDGEPLDIVAGLSARVQSLLPR